MISTDRPSRVGKPGIGADFCGTGLFMAKKSSRITAAEKKKITYALIALAAAVILLIIPQTRNTVLEYLGFFETDTPQAEVPDGEIAVHFIDVGQGDSELIMTSDGKTMLIDAGTPDSRSVLTEYLKNQGVKKIDYFVLTHPHADHIGGAAAVLDAFDVVNVIMTDVQTTTSTYKKVLQKIDEKECGVIFAEAGKEYSLGEAKFTLLGPVSDYSDDLNNTSIVLRLTFGKTSFMFTGDAEKKAEQDMLAKFPASYFRADVLKLGHHGSSTSTSDEWFFAVSPEYAVISCGKNNDYGHPHRETLSLLKKNGTTYFRTDTDGSIVMSSDGESVKIISPSGR